MVKCPVHATGAPVQAGPYTPAACAGALVIVRRQEGNA